VLAEYQCKGTFQFWEMPLYAGEELPSLPIVRRWLGDKPIRKVQYVRHLQGFSEADLTRLQKVFPEAEFSEPLMEPCHPGCFPAGTLVDTPRGALPIEGLQAGETVTVVDAHGNASTDTIRSVFTTTNRMWEVRTDQGTITTTETQPLCREAGEPKRAGELQPGDLLLRLDADQFLPAIVEEVAATNDTSRVFNLVLDDADVYIAGGFLARSKPPGELASN
jgi:hypothetical protein